MSSSRVSWRFRPGNIEFLRISFFGRFFGLIYGVQIFFRAQNVLSIGVRPIFGFIGGCIGGISSISAVPARIMS